MNLRQSKEFAKFLRLSGWLVEKTDNCYVYIRKLPLLPPLIMKVQYPTSPIPFGKIEKLAQKYKPLQIQIQPLKIESGFKKYGYKLSKSAGHVSKTIHLDLTCSEKKIFAQIKKDTHYAIRKAKKERIKIIEVKNLEQFHQSWKKSVGWRRCVPSLKTLLALKKSFGKNAIFLTGNCLAGTVILIAGKTAYYYYAFSSEEGRKKLTQYLLVWQAIKEAKKRGCQIFDFEGIYDERFPKKSWLGFSHFKKSFGGKEVEYPGSFVKFYNPILKFISKLQIPI